jgi:CBS domain containing-hemolysin-like protein
LLARTKGRWLIRLALVIRTFLWIVWPFRVLLEVAGSLARISDDHLGDSSAEQEERIGAIVDAAEQEGILDPGEAQMIEQVVEFSDKRVLEFMTPRPEVIAIPANATAADLRKVLINTKFSRIPVYEDTLDDITGIAFARDLLQIPESEAAARKVRELARPAFFVPETKHGSDLLKEMQRRNQQMAIVVDEHGSVAGIVTVEDLVEEIIGEIGEDDRVPSPDAVRETDGSLVLRGSVSVEKVQELFAVEWNISGEESATTIGGLLNHVAGHVPVAGEHLDYGGLRFEVLEANQRKVLRLRARRLSAVVTAMG